MERDLFNPNLKNRDVISSVSEDEGSREPAAEMQEELKRATPSAHVSSRQLQKDFHF